MNEIVKIKDLGTQAYQPILEQLKTFTHARDTSTIDEIWTLQHEQVYTQGQAGKAEHVLNANSIPIIQSDRGGQITYHGPGQLIVYLLADIARKKINIRQFISYLETSVIELLNIYNIQANTRANAPGVYVDDAKICALGIRVRHGRTYHGLSLNVAMDLEPFKHINPCGYSGLRVTQLSDLGGPTSIVTVAQQLIPILNQKIGYRGVADE